MHESLAALVLSNHLNVLLVHLGRDFWRRQLRCPPLMTGFTAFISVNHHAPHRGHARTIELSQRPIANPRRFRGCHRRTYCLRYSHVHPPDPGNRADRARDLMTWKTSDPKIATIDPSCPTPTKSSSWMRCNINSRSLPPPTNCLPPIHHIFCDQPHCASKKRPLVH